MPVISSGVSPEGFVSFLVEIGRQGLQPLSWFPGFDVPGIPRWPRFTSGRLVLFRRRWIVAPGELPATADAALFAEVARWRRQHGIPRHVFVHTAADPKPFHADLDSPLFVDLVRRAISGEPPCTSWRCSRDRTRCGCGTSGGATPPSCCSS